MMTNFLPACAAAVAAILLSGCSATPRNTPMPTEVGTQGLALKRAFPKTMPEQSTPLSDSQLVLVPSESAAGMLMPIPFVGEIATSAYNKYEASELAKRYATLDVFDIVQRAMAGSTLLKQGDGKIAMYPITYLSECTDGQYRFSLAGRIEQEKWVGRYVTHLPTTYSKAELSAGASATLMQMRQELEAAAATLRQLLERDADGSLNTLQYRADIGSLHLTCAKVAGLVSANLLLARDAEVVEDSADHIIVRVDGDLSQTGPSGGLMYGLHYLRKQDLRTLNRKQK